MTVFTKKAINHATISNSSYVQQSCTPNKNKNISNDEEEDRELFLSYWKESNLPHPKHWSPNQEEETTLYVNASIRGRNILYDVPLRRKDGCSPSFPLNGESISFHGPLFHGWIVSRVKQQQQQQNTSYFQNRSRQFQWIVQGQFHHRTRFDQISTGQDFGRPFRNAPAGPLVKRVISLLKHKLPETFEWYVLPSMIISIHSYSFYFKINDSLWLVNLFFCFVSTIIGWGE